ncbi:hypothetical protein PH189_28955 [Actinomycetospora chibensis]|nr:hypothetical protein [Actinomycetospora chibensis]MDD7927619.1 hypothetical protein [Actinomycetospora chibensis]
MGVEGDVAAVDDLFAEQAPATLDAGLHPGDGQAELGGGALLGQPGEVGEFEGVPVVLGDAVEQDRQAPHDRLLRTRLVGLVGGEVVAEGDVSGPGPGGRAAVVVDNRGAGDAVHPGVDRQFVVEIPDAAVEPQQGVLGDVLGVLRVADPAADEGAQRGDDGVDVGVATALLGGGTAATAVVVGHRVLRVVGWVGRAAGALRVSGSVGSSDTRRQGPESLHGGMRPSRRPIRRRRTP